MKLVDCGGDIYFEELLFLTYSEIRKNEKSASKAKKLPIFEVYPNTVKDELRITSKIKINNVQIQNVRGETILNNLYDCEIVNIDIGMLPIDTYYIKVNQLWDKKMIKILNPLIDK